MSRLTVCQLLPELDEGGVERGTLEVASALAAHGHRALVISAGGRLVQRLEAAGARHIRLNIGRKTLWSLRHIAWLRELWLRERVDIVHARSRFPAWLAYLAWRGMPARERPRFMTTVHGAHSVNPYSAIMLKGERVVAISEFLREHLLKHYPAAHAERIVVVPRGVSRQEFPFGYRPPAQWLETWHATLPQLRGKKVLALPARMTRRKGQLGFIELMRRLRESLPVHGLLIGGSHATRSRYHDEVQRRIDNHRLRESITLLGHREDLKEILAVSDLTLALSEEPEAFGRVTLESLSLGTPVLGYAHGGTGEILRRLYPEGAVEPHDLESVIDRARRLLKDAPPVPAEHPYALETMLARTLDVYQSLAARV